MTKGPPVMVVPQPQLFGLLQASLPPDPIQTHVSACAGAAASSPPAINTAYRIVVLT
jgi:hypothetical protein